MSKLNPIHAGLLSNEGFQRVPQIMKSHRQAMSVTVQASWFHYISYQSFVGFDISHDFRYIFRKIKNVWQGFKEILNIFDEAWADYASSGEK